MVVTLGVLDPLENMPQVSKMSLSAVVGGKVGAVMVVMLLALVPVVSM
jgi:hypothetical protein